MQAYLTSGTSTSCLNREHTTSTPFPLPLPLHESLDSISDPDPVPLWPFSFAVDTSCHDDFRGFKFCAGTLLYNDVF